MKSNIGLSEIAVPGLVESLFGYLADSFILYVKTLNFHWNVEDPRFSSLHALFEEQYEALAENNDEVAERIRALGKQVPATLKSFLEESTMDEAPSGLKGQEMIKDLALSHESLIVSIRQMIAKFDAAGDQGTVDLLSGKLRFHEKSAWMLRSHLE